MFTHFSQRAVLVGFIALLTCVSATIWSVGTSASRKTDPDASTPATESIRVISLTANDIVYNPADDKLYASIPSAAGAAGNSIRQIDPRNGNVGDPVWVGSEPNKLAMANDGQSLYVSLDGAYAVRRFNVATQTAGTQFSTSFGSSGRYSVGGIAVSPDDPNVVAIGRVNNSVSPPGAGVAIFSSGTQLPSTTPGHSEGSDSLAFSATGSTLYGTGIYSGLKSISVSGSGATVATNTSLASGTRIKFSSGRVYSSSGHVIDSASLSLLGTFPFVGTPAFVPDGPNGRAYYLVRDTSTPNTWILKAFDINTYTLIGSLPIGGVVGDATTMIRWGGNGLAFRTTGNQLFVVQTTLIPSGDPIPTPTPPTTPSPTPTPTAVPTNVSYVPLYGNGLEYNPASQRLYVSVPSAMGATGNNLATVEPAGGAVENSVFVGSEPGKMALASDSQTLYVALNGARQIRKFDTASQTAGNQFSAGINNFDGPLAIQDFALPPDSVGSIAMSATSTVSFPGLRATVIMDDGVLRPAVRSDAINYAVSFGNSGSVLYGSGNYGGLNTMTVTATGITANTNIPFDGGTRIQYVNGRVYSSRGQVIDTGSQSLLGTFNLGSATSDNPRFVVDMALNRIFFLVTNPGLQIQVFDLNTFVPLGTIQLPSLGLATDIKRWGSNGLAISHSNAPLVIIRSELVNPNETVIVTPPVPPTPIPTPTPMTAFARRIDQLNNDLAYNQLDGKLYVTVPGVATDGSGNTITRIDPQNGSRVSSTFIGSEPKKIAMSADGQTLYTVLTGAQAIRRFDTVTQTPGIQFSSLHNGYQPSDMAVDPANSNRLVIGAGDGGAAMFDNGVKLPATPNVWIGPVEFGASPNVLYGYNNVSTGFDLYKTAVSANGLTVTGSTSNLIYGFGNLEMTFRDGRIYVPAGRIVDPESKTISGLLQMTDLGRSITVDTTLRRAFIASDTTITAFDIDTFRKVGTINLPYLNGSLPTSLVRWGTNGLAFRVGDSSTNSYLYVLQSPVVAPGPIPTGILHGASGYQYSEGHPVPATVTVTRTGDLSAASTINYTTVDGTAVAGVDYFAVNGTLTFAPAESSKSISVQIRNDQIFEGNETFGVQLSNPTGPNTELLGPNTANVTISDNDNRPSMTGFDSRVNEIGPGNTSIATITVMLTNPSVETVTVNYATANGTAIAGSDYQATSGTLTFSPLETSKTIAVVINGDSLIEGSESFFVNLSAPTNGTIFDGQAMVTIVDFHAPFDFDGDGKTDIGIYRPNGANGSEWWINRSSNDSTFATQFGAATDKVVSTDFTGDGKADVAFWRPSTGFWYVLRSEDLSYYAVPFGANGDIPVPADYDGDGKADRAVFRPSSSTWYIEQTGGGTRIEAFGATGDKPVVADYDGDGKADLAIFRPTGGSGSGEWWINRSTAGLQALVFGVSTDKPVQGDYTGDGKADIAFWRPSTGEWYVLRSENLTYYSTPFGSSSDIPTPGDYDGDGKFDTAVYRPSDTNWYVQRTTAGTLIRQFGSAGDQPIPNAFVP